MAQENYPVDKKIKFGYQAPNAESGLNVRADILRPDESIFLVDDPLHEVNKSPGTYRGEFTPNQDGEWQVVMYKFIDSNNRDGQVTKSFSVGTHSVSGVGAAIADVDTDVALLDDKIEIIGDKVDQLDTPPMAF